MKIRELNIIEFGGLSDRHYTLDEGLNIFEGDNEAGKSTVWLFIKFMLYGMAKKGTPERERSVSRFTHRAAGSMVLTHGGITYRIERSFSENARGKVTTYNVDSGEKVFSGAEPGEVMLGVPRDVFENSCGIGQSECTDLGGDKGVAAIRNLLSSADEKVDIKKIEKRLDDIRVLYRHKKGNGGMLSDMSDKISEYERRLDIATNNKLRITDVEEKLRKNIKAAEETEEKLKVSRTILEQAQKMELIRRFELCEENRKKLSALTNAKEQHKKENLRTEYMPIYTDVAQLNMLSESLSRANAEIARTEAELSNVESECPYDKEKATVGKLIESLGGKDLLIDKIKKLKGRKAFGGVLVGIGGAFVLGGIPIAILIKPILIGIILSVVGAIALSVGISLAASTAAKLRGDEYAPFSKGDYCCYVNTCSSAYESEKLYKKQIAELESKQKNDISHRDRIISDLERALKKTAPESPVSSEAAKAEAERLRGLLERLSELTRDADRLTAVVENDEKILSSYDEAQLRETFTLSAEELSEATVKDAEIKKRFYEEQIRVQRQRDQSLRTELINLNAVSEDPSAIADRLAELKDNYEKADFYYDALVTAIEGIQNASEALQGNITPMIGRNAGKMMEFITDGRYSAINMSKDMEVSLVDASGMTTTPEMMSGGTKDAAYLGLRISVMMQVFGEELPPLMMDDTLCQLDDQRAGRILSLIGKLCDGDLQCLLFSCHKRERIYCGDNGIEANVIRM